MSKYVIAEPVTDTLQVRFESFLDSRINAAVDFGSENNAGKRILNVVLEDQNFAHLRQWLQIARKLKDISSPKTLQDYHNFKAMYEEECNSDSMLFFQYLTLIEDRWEKLLEEQRLQQYFSEGMLTERDKGVRNYYLLMLEALAEERANNSESVKLPFEWRVALNHADMGNELT